jgi:glycogen(starch) synthase
MFWPYIGGSEIFAANLLCALKERHDFVVVAHQHSADMPQVDDYRGIPIHRLPFCTALATRDLDQITALRRQVDRLKRELAPDLIHLHNFGPTVLFHRETAGACRAPVLLTLQVELSPYKKNGADSLLTESLRSATWVTCVSSETLAQARRCSPEIISRSSVIFNSLAVPTVAPRPLATPPRFLCIGRLERQKGFDLLLAAFAPVVERFPDARLTIAGDGSQRAALERQCADLHLTRVVDFTGWIAPGEIPELINTSSAVIIPSRWEGLPLVGIQAASMVRPIVATRISGLSELVAHRQTGLLIEPEDVSGLTDALSFLLAHPDRAAEMGSAGHRRVQELFSWEKCVDAYDALYRRLGGAYCG